MPEDFADARYSKVNWGKIHGEMVENLRGRDLVMGKNSENVVHSVLAKAAATVFTVF